jgi:hypothetical protein
MLPGYRTSFGSISSDDFLEVILALSRPGLPHSKLGFLILESKGFFPSSRIQIDSAPFAASVFFELNQT